MLKKEHIPYTFEKKRDAILAFLTLELIFDISDKHIRCSIMNIQFVIISQMYNTHNFKRFSYS